MPIFILGGKMKKKVIIEREIEKTKKHLKLIEDEINEINLTFREDQKEKLVTLLKEKFNFEEVGTKMITELFDIDYREAIYFLYVLFARDTLQDAITLMRSPKTGLFYYITRTVTETFYPITTFHIYIIDEDKMKQLVEEFKKEIAKKIKIKN